VGKAAVRARLTVATALAGALLVSVSGADAAPPVIDGKKVKVLTKTVKGGTQQSMQDLAFDATLCAAPRCAVLPFVYKPAKGAKTGLMFTATWTNPLSDLDLSVVEVGKNRTESVIASCGAGTYGSTKERVYLSGRELRAGGQYRMVVDFWRSIDETVTEKVQIGVPNDIPAPVPAAVNDLRTYNCTQ
jgi:hypothetical protein